MSPFERWSVRVTSLAVAVTGFALLWLKYGFESADPFAVINHPFQPWALKTHVLVAPVFLFAIGLIATRHIWRHVVRKVEPGRKSGLITLVSLLPMIASGYALQVVVSETWRLAAVVTHVASSVLFTVGLGAHLVMMWRYLRTVRNETFCSQERMKETPGLGEIDERHSAERDLAEVGGPAR